jgi:hypothetical protein
MWFEVNDGFESYYLQADSQEDAERRALMLCVGPVPATNAIANFAEFASVKQVAPEEVNQDWVVSADPAPLSMVDELAKWRAGRPSAD